jgi:hypothetical protein
MSQTLVEVIKCHVVLLGPMEEITLELIVEFRFSLLAVIFRFVLGADIGLVSFCFTVSEDRRDPRNQQKLGKFDC